MIDFDFRTSNHFMAMRFMVTAIYAIPTHTHYSAEDVRDR